MVGCVNARRRLAPCPSFSRRCSTGRRARGAGGRGREATIGALHLGCEIGLGGSTKRARSRLRFVDVVVVLLAVAGVAIAAWAAWIGFTALQVSARVQGEATDERRRAGARYQLVCMHEMLNKLPELVPASNEASDERYRDVQHWLRTMLALAQARALLPKTVAIAEGAPEELRGIAHERVREARQEILHALEATADRASEAETVPSARTSAAGRTPELSAARRCLHEGELEEALQPLRGASSVAIAQRKRDEMLEVRDLAEYIASRRSGRTKDAAVRLAAKITRALEVAFPEAEANVDDRVVQIAARPRP